MAERTFILIKPDHVVLADKILSEMDGQLEDIAKRKATDGADKRKLYIFCFVF